MYEAEKKYFFSWEPSCSPPLKIVRPRGEVKIFFQLKKNDSCFICIKATFVTQNKSKLLKMRNNIPPYSKC